MADYLEIARQAQARYRAEHYREALRLFWRLNAAEAEVSPAAAMQAHNEVIKLTDEIGEPRATILRHRWEAEWYAEAGVCPRCGERGERHL
jgi:hypothetical protein